MVKAVIWSRRALEDRFDIFEYWNQCNGSDSYSLKLDSLFKKAIQLIVDYPEIGRPTNDKKARIKLVRDYLIIYEIDGIQQLIILTIWDNRRHPDKLKVILGK